jgi:hypothetical protein
MLVSPDYLGTVFYVLRSTALEGFNYCGQLFLNYGLGKVDMSR